MLRNRRRRLYLVFPIVVFLLSSEERESFGIRIRASNIDWHLNELYDFLFTLDVNVISTSISRYVVDLNRSTDSELFGDYKCSLIYKKKY